ncbi:hypothetical protein [Bosea sp. (in: a-proteobacteria)]|uniref:hypothetical protein n=1 Tax=Bosea sp. (in: a-proteobacteria) TaxID=1871050 RepID=UPI003F71BA6C
MAVALDRLALAYHACPDEWPGEHPDEIPAQTTYKQMRERAVRAFPGFGYYTTVRPDQIAPGDARTLEAMVGDALNDITDIACDLQGVAWRWDNTSPADAVWYFRFGFQSHWGRHLHDLRSYAHARMFED